MRQLSCFMSPVSWLLALFLVAPSWLVLFSPSWRDIALLAGVELATFGVVALACHRRILALLPEAKLFHCGLDWPALEALPSIDQEALLQSLREYPGLRLRVAIPILLLQSVPVAVLIYFTWEPAGGAVSHLVKTLAIVTFTRVYGLGCVFVDGNLTVSQLRSDIRARLGWSVAFARERSLRPATEFETVEAAVIAALLAFYTFAAYATLSGEAYSLGQTIAIVGFQMAACFVLAMRFQYLTRQYRSAFLDDVMRRLDEKERELSTWVLDHAERQRFRTFGEVAGLVVHDLANPIHTVAFCAEALTENPQAPKREHYIEIILKNCEKVSGLVKSLRTYLKRGAAEDHARLAVVHQNVSDILAIQYAAKNLQRVQQVWDPHLDDVVVKIPSNEIMHILMNVYANAVKNFVEHRIAEPCIATTLVQKDDGFVTFAVADNGAGLSPAGFQSLVTAGFMMTPAGRREGLGLRLGARLLEQHGGAIHLDETYFQEGRGTRLLLKLPLYSSPTSP